MAETGRRIPIIGAVVVTYFPDAMLPARLAATHRQVDALVVVDNASPESYRSALRDIARETELELILSASNGGIAKALNEGIAQLADAGVEWVLTLDQDSDIADDFVARMRERLERLGATHDVALIGAGGRIDQGIGARAKWLRPWLGGVTFERVGCDRTDERGVTQVITSGTLTHVESWKALGGFREELFIDLVDFDFCLRARRAQRRILLCCAARYAHQVGRKTDERYWGIAVRPTHHAAIRRYYLCRNSVDLIRRHGRAVPHWVGFQLAALAEILIGIVLFETEKRRKLNACWLGLLDGWRGRMGVCERSL